MSFEFFHSIYDTASKKVITPTNPDSTVYYTKLVANVVRKDTMLAPYHINTVFVSYACGFRTDYVFKAKDGISLSGGKDSIV